MAAEFLHGVETIVIEEGPRPVTEVKTAVIGLVGIAPQGPTNKVTLVKNDVDAAAFGKKLPGFDIPQALDLSFGHNAGTVIVVNVFDEDTHTTAVVEESHAIAAGKIKLSFTPIGDVEVLDAAGDPSGFVAGTDYSIDEFGNFKVIAGAIANAVTLKFNYKKLNTGAINAALIIGTVDGDGNRTGIKALDLASQEFGFAPKILCVPGRSGLKTVATEMLTSAEKLRAVALIDSTLGDDVEDAIISRADAAEAFGTSDKRAILCYPHIKAYDASKDDGDPDTDTKTNYPYSMFLAGVIAATDKKFGYWFSPSNKEIKGVLGVERSISANLQDPTTDVNALNAAGIVSIFNSFGSGYRTWGNRNASFPTNTQTDNFIPLLRTFDVVHESLERAALPFADLPITQAMIDDVRQSGNDFVSVLIARGALTQGSRVIFERSRNSNAQLSAGRVAFTIIKDGPSPAERITYYSIIDTNLKTKAIV